jgi:hypothetical protein
VEAALSPEYKTYLLGLFSEERESFAAYERLCARYKVTPDPIVVATSTARMDLLKELLSRRMSG